MSAPPTPRLTLGHSTLAVRDIDTMVSFYCDTLGFAVTNRGEPAPGAGQMVFLSQDPSAHHQIVMVESPTAADHGFVLADHLAFRTGTLDDLREIGRRLNEADIDPPLPICHGNAWSLYFTDPEGNGLECFVDTPFHVAQPFGAPFELTADDDEIEAVTLALIEQQPEFGPFDEWRARLADRLAQPEG